MAGLSFQARKQQESGYHQQPFLAAFDTFGARPHLLGWDLYQFAKRASSPTVARVVLMGERNECESIMYVNIPKGLLTSELDSLNHSSSSLYGQMAWFCGKPRHLLIKVNSL